MKTVVCVLWMGDFKNRNKPVVYRPEHVRWLQLHVKRHLKCAHRFVCLSNTYIDGVETIDLREGWPGWWSKIEMFNPAHGLTDAFFIDLDTVVLGDITKMVTTKHRFTALRNLSGKDCIGSGLMAWSGDYRAIYEEFKAQPRAFMEAYSVSSERWGDQGFIQDFGPRHFEFFQQRFPGQILSFKNDLGYDRSPSGQTRIVCFNGRPKPWDLRLGWISRDGLDPEPIPEKRPMEPSYGL